MNQVEFETLAVEFLLDVVHPEGYGHAMPKEVIVRANRLLQLYRACIAAKQGKTAAQLESALAAKGERND